MLREEIQRLQFLAVSNPSKFEDEINTIVKAAYKNGKTVGLEIAIKDAKKRLGLCFEGKTIDSLLEGHAKKILSYVRNTTPI